jgi:hypothetical protein
MFVYFSAKNTYCIHGRNVSKVRKPQEEGCNLACLFLGPEDVVRIFLRNSLDFYWTTRRHIQVTVLFLVTTVNVI